MKSCNLNYHFSFRLFVCSEHDSCVFVSIIESHLKKQHKVKEKRLQAVLIEIRTHDIRDSRQVHLFTDIERVFELRIEFEFRCDACIEDNRLISKNRRTIEKHLSSTHDIENAKNKISVIENDVQSICVQFFCFAREYRSFALRFQHFFFSLNDNQISLISFDSQHADTSMSNRVQTKMNRKYEINCATWSQAFDIMSSSDVYVDQTLSWLRTTSIFNWMTKLRENKKTLRDLLSTVSSDKFLQLFYIAWRLTACHRLHHFNSRASDRSSSAANSHEVSWQSHFEQNLSIYQSSDCTLSQFFREESHSDKDSARSAREGYHDTIRHSMNQSDTVLDSTIGKYRGLPSFDNSIFDGIARSGRSS